MPGLVNRIVRVAGAVLLLAAGPGPAKAQAPVVEGRSPGGIVFHHVVLPDTPLQSVAFGWKDGTALAGRLPEWTGSLGTRLMFSGAGGLREGALVEAWRDQLGGANLSQTMTHTVGIMTVPASKLAAAGDLLRASLVDPDLPQPALERLRKQMADSSRQGGASSGGQARRSAVLALFGDTPESRFLTMAPPSIIERVERTDIATWRTAVLVRQGLVVTSAGPADTATLGPAIDRIFSGLPAGPAAAASRSAAVPAARPLTVAIERAGSQSTVILVGPVIVPPGEARVRLQMGLQVLGSGSNSRLFRVLREKLGATYGASASLQPVAGDLSLIVLEAGISTDRIKPALAALREEYERWRATGIEMRELDTVRTARIAGIRQARTQPANVAAALRDLAVQDLPLGDFDLAEARARDATPATVSAEISARMPAALVTVVVTPSATAIAADCVVRNAEEVAGCR